MILQVVYQVEECETSHDLRIPKCVASVSRAHAAVGFTVWIVQVLS